MHTSEAAYGIWFFARKALLEFLTQNKNISPSAVQFLKGAFMLS